MSFDKIYLIREADNYKYIMYFKLTGERKDGYCKQMFNQNCTRLMVGAQRFREVGFEIELVNKGKETWKKFQTMMIQEEYTLSTNFTRVEA